MDWISSSLFIFTYTSKENTKFSTFALSKGVYFLFIIYYFN